MNGDSLRIVLLRTARGAPDPFVAAFEAVGFEAVCVPSLRFEFVDGEALAERLRQPGRYGGLVLTSPRAAEAVRRAGELPEAWRERPAFAVGPATGEAARALGLEATGEGAGTAAALAAVIGAEPPTKPLLFLAGDRRRDDLPEALDAARIPFEEVTVYRTLLLPVRLPEPAPEWTAFFSPSGVEAALASAGFPWNSLRTAAIGPTTAAALRAAGHPPEAVAAHPTPEALAAAVLARA